MKVALIVDIVNRVNQTNKTEAEKDTASILANLGIREKVVWARFGGLFPFAFLPRHGEIIKIWPSTTIIIDPNVKAKIVVTEVRHSPVEDSLAIFKPMVLTEYVIPSEQEMSIEDRIVRAQTNIQRISDWLLRHSFSLCIETSYSYRD